MKDTQTEIRSPLTSGKAFLIEKIPSARIVKEYEKDLALDVSAFFKDVPEVSIYQCADTGFRFYLPRSIFADEAFYALLQQREYYSVWHWEHERAYQQLARGNKVLEVGCGTGSFLVKLKDEGFDCTGLELNGSAVEVCKQKGLNVHRELAEAHANLHPGIYDAVCSFQVFEHVFEIGSLFNSCIKCLKPGGKLIVAVPNSNPYLFKHDKYHSMNLPPHHSGLWNRAAFQKLPEFFPLRVETIRREPLYNRRYFVQTWLEHHKFKSLKKLTDKLSPRTTNTLLWPLKLFVPGRNIVAVFVKTS